MIRILLIKLPTEIVKFVEKLTYSKNLIKSNSYCNFTAGNFINSAIKSKSVVSRYLVFALCTTDFTIDLCFCKI